MYKVSDNAMVFCPYNRYHIVSKLRIQKHITKCKKNYPDVTLATCFYNFTHRLKPEDMLEHYEICPYKTRIECAGEYEHNCLSLTNTSRGKSGPYTRSFPDINVKPKIFSPPSEYPTFSSPTSDAGQKSESSGSSEIKYNIELKPKSDYVSEKGPPDDTTNDNELEPLPLPKTVSKAFVYVRESEVVSPEASKITNQKQRDSNNTSRVKTSRIKSSTFSLKPNICNVSVASSSIDDATTFQSEDIIFSDDYSDEGRDSNDSIVKKFEKYMNV